MTEHPTPQPKPIDSLRKIAIDFIAVELLIRPIIATKPIRGIFPEPFDIGFHTGNTGMTMAAIVVPLALMRTWQMRPGRTAEQLSNSRDYTELRRRIFKVATIASLAVNIGAELKDDIYGDQMKGRLTPDPIDIVYGIGGGLLAAEIISWRFKDGDKSTNNSSTALEQKTPVRKVTNEKVRSNRQKNSRRCHRR